MKMLSALLFGLLIQFPAAQAEQATLPDTMQSGSDVLIQNGAGDRTKLFLPVYRIGLYLKQKNNDAQSILAADEPMAMRMVITSSLVTEEKMSRATREGFQKSTGGNTDPIAPQIDKMIMIFGEGIDEGDVFDMIYQPGLGTRLIKNDEEKGIAEGPQFKKALFGIWISNDPVQKKLKKALLGN